MYPSFAMDDIENQPLTDIVPARQSPLGDAIYRALSDIANILFGEFGPAISLAFCCSVLFHHIAAVVGITPKKETARVHAALGVTMMQNAQAGRNRTTGNSPCDSMRGESPASAVCSQAETELAILFPSARLPQPAFIESTNTHFLPESEDVLRSQRWDGTVRSTYGGFLSKSPCQNGLWPNAAGRSFQGHLTKRAA